jgi:hypothetical protein
VGLTVAGGGLGVRDVVLLGVGDGVPLEVPLDAGGVLLGVGVGVLLAVGVGVVLAVGVGVLEATGVALGGPGPAGAVVWSPLVAAGGSCVVSLVTWVTCVAVGWGSVGLALGVTAATATVGAAIFAAVESILAARLRRGRWAAGTPAASGWPPALTGWERSATTTGSLVWRTEAEGAGALR